MNPGVWAGVVVLGGVGAVLRFLVDGAVVRTCPAPPTYPMQLMLAVFDFPDRSVGDDEAAVPELVVDRIEGDG